MKQSVSPGVFVGVILVGILVLAFIGYRVMNAPTITPAAEASTPSGAPNPITGASGIAGPRAGGGPTAEAFKQRDEYNRQHRDAQGSGTGH
jgi:hypothetical protein